MLLWPSQYIMPVRWHTNSHFQQWNQRPQEEYAAHWCFWKENVFILSCHAGLKIDGSTQTSTCNPRSLKPAVCSSPEKFETENPGSCKNMDKGYKNRIQIIIYRLLYAESTVQLECLFDHHLNNLLNFGWPRSYWYVLLALKTDIEHYIAHDSLLFVVFTKDQKVVSRIDTEKYWKIR